MSGFWSKLNKPGPVLGGTCLAFLAICGLFAPQLAPGDPLAITGPALAVPFRVLDFPLGTDRLGRDVVSGLIHGARVSLTVGLAASGAALVIGSVVGLAAGFAGGWIDEFLMRVTDAFQTVPAFLLALAIISVLGPSVTTIVAAVTIGAWTAPARVMRAEVLSHRERDYVAAARVTGMHPLEIAIREILPNVLPPVIALTPILVASAILTEAALSFLGLGDPNRVTWGAMIAEGRSVLRTAPSLSLIPGAALVLAVLSVYLLGDGLAEARLLRRPA